MYTVREKYTDFRGNEREEDFYFNLSESDLTKMQYSVNGGYDAYLKRIIDAQDQKTIMEVFEEIIAMSYGVISDDGRRFVKNAEVLDDFKSTEAYNQIFMRLISDSAFASDFVNHVFPENILKSVQANGGNIPEIFKNNADGEKAVTTTPTA